MTPTPSPRPRSFLAAALLAFSLAAAAPAAAQEGPVTLVADSVVVEDGSVLTAEGSVEVFSDGIRMTASRLTYDQEANRLSVEGPITLSDGPGTLVIADAADLSADLREGIVEGVRIILGQQVQIAASSAQRQQGRFTDLRDGIATSCEICTPGETPMWHIRARRVIHDEERKRIYFQHAQFRIYGIPVAYLPAISTPEPGVERARGFLVPSIESSNLYGNGIKLPYFVPLGDHADLTFTPFYATDFGGKETKTLEGRYRQAFATGDIQFDGAVTQDTIEPGTRAYLFGTGQFDLPWQTKLSFGVQLVTDDTYLNDYDYSGADRLKNRLSLTRIVGDSRAEGSVTVFHSLRDDEDNDTIPTLTGNARYDRRWQVDGVPGYVDFALIGHGHERTSTEDIVGRDMAQGRAYLRWGNEATFGPGIRLAADARAIGDVKHIIQDSRYESYQAALTPGASVTASLPMKKAGKDGVSYLLEPMAQAVWVGPYDIDSPNDDSTQPAFDLGNLMGYQRFPGLDRVEDGLRANLALRWQRYAPSGWTLGLTGGRVLRAQADGSFSPGTGLAGTRSDWLTQIDVDYEALKLRNLALIADNGSVTLNELRLAYISTKFDLAAGYVWQIEDPALNQDEDLSEATFDGTYRISDAWEAQMDLRRDLISSRTTRAGFGLTWRNECVRVDLSGARRFRNNDGAEPTYTYGLTVSLTGFGTGGSDSRPRTGRCS
ncbi:LPS-assembly protein LptD [Mangrovicoccus sp. HB161399]|uniref:LPS-assembly protein LptD n=1 Tax=Mangrovicoccus sp. HB161399 TaxID=2720392 RepID=UPI0015522ACA|nr:LPS assembly protein LptD [Mangrovicoccus sp. HB161399]